MDLNDENLGTVVSAGGVGEASAAGLGLALKEENLGTADPVIFGASEPSGLSHAPCAVGCRKEMGCAGSFLFGSKGSCLSILPPAARRAHVSFQARGYEMELVM